MTRLMKLALVFIPFIFVLNGCAYYVKSIEHSSIGDCLQLRGSARLYDVRPSQYSDEYMIGLTTSVMGRKHAKLLTELQPGDRVEVHSVIAGSDWSNGPFRRVKVRVLNGTYKGVVADVPTNAPSHPSPSWILANSAESVSDFESPIVFDSQVVIPCALKRG